MSIWWQSLQRWWQARNEREQRMLQLGAIVAVLIALLGLILPLWRSAALLQQRVATKQSDLVWLRSMEPQLAASLARNASTSAGGESLIALADRSARESGLAHALTGSQPAGDGGLRLRLEAASFDQLIGWLGMLRERNGVRVEQISIDRTAQPGAVNASLVLRER